MVKMMLPNQVKGTYQPRKVMVAPMMMLKSVLLTR